MHGLKNRAIAGILTGNQLSKIASKKLKTPGFRWLSKSVRPSGRDEARFVTFPHGHRDHRNDTISAILPAVLKHNFPSRLVSETLLFGSNCKDKKRPSCPGPKSKAPPTCPPPKPPCPPKCPPPEAPKCPPKPCPPPQTPKCPPKPPKSPPKPCRPPQTPKCPPEPPKCPPKPAKNEPKPCPPKKSCLSVFLPVQEKSVVEFVNSVDDFLGNHSSSGGELSAKKYGYLVSKSDVEFGGKKSRGKCGKTRRKKPRGCGSGGKKKNGFKKSTKRNSSTTIKKDSGNVKPKKMCGPAVKKYDPNWTPDRYL